MSRPLWFVDLLKRAYPARFLLARLTRLPVLDRIVDHLFFEGDHLVYLPQDRLIEVNEDIDQPPQTPLPSQVVDHFIEQAGVHWVMNTCICRESEGCKDYPVDLGCLFLGDAALGINPALGRLVSKDEALEHVRKCREAGLVHLVGRNKIDTVWLGVGPGDKLLTICNCCPCCCLWRILPTLAPQIGDKIQAMPGVSVTVTDSCIGCGICAEGVCFTDAISIVDGRANISDACRGCGRCAQVCPQGAIEVSIEDGGLVQQVIAGIAPLVDVG